MTNQEHAPEEAWKPVLGFEGLYEVSDQGNVRSLNRTIPHGNGSSVRSLQGRTLQATPNQRGYLTVALWADGAERRKLVHRLVLEAFLGPCPDGMEGCHRDGNRTDNRLARLRWDSHSENMRDVNRYGVHHHTAKSACPQGHHLVAPNLIPARLEKGWRICHSCALASYAASRSARRLGIIWTADQQRREADRRYRLKGLSFQEAAA